MKHANFIKKDLEIIVDGIRNTRDTILKEGIKTKADENAYYYTARAIEYLEMAIGNIK